MNMAFRKLLLNGGLILIATITITFPTANCIEYDDPVNYNNLPEIVPLHYNVEIRFLYKDNILLGQCGIVIRTNRVLNLIKLNTVPVHTIEAVLTNSKKIVIPSSVLTNHNTILPIQLHRNISTDTYTLNFTYMRVIYENSNVYQSVHLDKLGEMLNKTGIVIMDVSQLFPYMNESTTKSTFKIAIKHDEEYTVLSNMPIRVRNKANNRMMWTDFDESLSMSLQHIRVVITTFTNVSSHLANVTIWCRQSAQQLIYYARDVIEKVMPYFKQKYMQTLSKLDIIAFRHPYNHNDVTLGLVLLREADIIYNETLHPVIRKREVAHMMARQLAFIWCEDALLWSKESFVTFFGVYILNQVYENDHIMDLEVVQAQQDSLRYDTPSTLYSPTLNSTNISQVNSLGSPPNHIKSFIIWRMLYHIIPDEFWSAIRTHIDKHRMYLNMTPDDLWNTMQTIHNESDPKHMLSSHLKEIITNWITEKYYFILNVKQSHFPKQHFLGWEISYIQSPNLSLKNKTKIWIHVTYMSQSSSNFNKTVHSSWITSNIANIQFADSNYNATDCIIVNIQQTGYYRVHYDEENWQKLLRYLNSENYTKIHILYRAKIIDDAFYFFLQKELSYNFFWNLTSFVIQDANFVTWYPMIKVFESFACLYPLEYGYEITKDVNDRINQLLTKIGYTEKPTDHTLTIYLRQEAVKWACMLGSSDNECQEVATSKFNKEFQNSAGNNNLAGKKWIYCTGLKTANYTIWYTIWQKWKATSNENYLEYLTCTEKYDFICAFLRLILLKNVQPNDSKWTTRRANAFLFTVAKQAKIKEVISCLFKILKHINFSSNRRNDIIATLIVIITHIDAVHHIEEIIKFASNYQIVTAVQLKIRKRRLEYGNLTRKYNYYFSSALSEAT